MAEEKKYSVSAVCPECGASEQLQIEGSNFASLPEGEAPKALAECSQCGKPFNAPVNSDTCAEWDDFCKEVHPVPQV